MILAVLTPVQRLANRFLKGAVSSDEEVSDEEDKTVVLSAKDKR